MHHNFRPNSDNNPEHITPKITPEEFSEKEFLVPYILKGTRQQISNTMHILNAMGYAQLSEWSPLQPTGIPGQFITIMRRYWIWR
ncbi:MULTISPECIES: hypothetical protein [unclassified Moorena]|uniref:hypothetical protein n=1 Tax=unclassified Moorena TaxID=2683338 RepID=UPI0013BCA2BD|nr:MULTISPECIES: hypothetical protein [unclassified Moorena]NEP34955.1 hypothetical protein [Moorena sp. SIO3B2]NEP64048.1 hypothetical protein [Moorena sp. SIO3A5]NEQ08136.1 hypothetical protein [Moorena sp. SIO4E2]NES87408.1 hypothetical protein [Moorena sp. SIO2B7]